MLRARIITSLVLLPILLLVVWALPFTFFAAFSVLMIALCAWEWGNLVLPNSLLLKLCSVLLFFVFAGLLYFILMPSPIFLFAVPLWIMILVWVILFQFDISFLLHWQWLRFILGAIVLTLALASMLYLKSIPHGSFWITYIMFIIFATDTGAYFAGSFLGRHKLIYKVSPNKTWEGLFGGVLLALLVTLLVMKIAPLRISHELFLIFFSIVLSLVSVIGDLFESMLKRMVGIKDSGNLLPGHGGVLDRADSMISAFSIAAVLIYWFL
jgi:phosphatidate cytidylyltransferase